MVKNDLTSKQMEILEFIKKKLEQDGYPPSVREIGEAVGLRSSSTVHMHLSKLEEKGYIRRALCKSRAIEVVKKPDEHALPEIVSLPLLGRVAAGLPITAQEDVEDYLALPAGFFGKGEHFLLRVKGDSMIEAGIFDGDLVVVRAQKTAENGDIVVALLEDEATVKRFYRRQDHIELKPENPALATIYCKEAAIVGVVVGLIRRFI